MSSSKVKRRAEGEALRCPLKGYSPVAPIHSAPGLSERMESRWQTPDLGGRRTRQVDRLEFDLTRRVHAREATKTGLEWRSTVGLPGNMKNQV